MFQINVAEKIKAQILCSMILLPPPPPKKHGGSEKKEKKSQDFLLQVPPPPPPPKELCGSRDNVNKNMAESDRPQMT